MKILQNNKEVTVLNLGRVRIGESKTYEYTLENDSNWSVEDIKLSLQDIDGKPVTEVDFLDYPHTLNGNSKGALTFSWTPTVELKKGLKTIIQIQADEIWT